MRYIRIPVFCAQSGYTPKAVSEKIRMGAWVEGRQYRRAPDGHILIDVEGFEKWVENQEQAA